MCPRPHLSLCACKTSWLAPELQVSVCPRPHLSFCTCKTAWLAQESLVSMGPSPHLWFLHAKQRVLDQIYNSLWIPDLTFRFVHAKTAWFPPEWQVYMGSSPHLWFKHAKQRILDWNKKYLSHRCNLSLCASNQSDLHQNDKFIMVPALISCKTATLRPDLQVCMGPRPHLWVWAHITACLAQE